MNYNYAKEWPKCYYFGIFDGHGGNKCSQYLHKRLHEFLINDENFPDNPVKALYNSFNKAEE